MSQLTNAQKENNMINSTSRVHALDAHQFLMQFLSKFDGAKPGGIHDFMEIALFNMVNSAIKNIDIYLQCGQKNVNANEVLSIFADSCQKILDNIKRNIEKMGQVNLK